MNASTNVSDMMSVKRYGENGEKARFARMYIGFTMVPLEHSLAMIHGRVRASWQWLRTRKPRYG